MGELARFLSEIRRDPILRKYYLIPVSWIVWDVLSRRGALKKQGFSSGIVIPERI